MSTPKPRGRWAPSPTGHFHLGNARTALVAWLSIRLQKGTLVWRVEDLDQPRTVPGLAEQQLDELRWLGLDWDEGPGLNSSAHVEGAFFQSSREELYLDALKQLESEGHLFPCQRSRREIREVASAPHGGVATPYPVSLRPAAIDDDWFEQALNQSPGSTEAHSIRFRVTEREVTFKDLMVGQVNERVDLTVGDFIVRRRDGVWAYQLAVVVDDIAMEINEVVRGADLLDSTARQILLFEALDAKPPTFGHVPLMLASDGNKLSKRDQATHLESLRERGVQANQVVAYLARSLSLHDSSDPTSARDLLQKVQNRCRTQEDFWKEINPDDVVVPSDIEDDLLNPA